MNTPTKEDVINTLDAMCLLQDTLENQGLLNTKMQSTCNKLYDEIYIGVLNHDPDGGEYQQKLKDEQFTLSATEARNKTLVAIVNLIQGAPIKLFKNL